MQGEISKKVLKETLQLSNALVLLIINPYHICYKHDRDTEKYNLNPSVAPGYTTIPANGLELDALTS